jgi:hypothetical protein
MSTLKSTALNAAKLGPKANQGAINAGLRALDRSGKPTRKWQKSAFEFRSFTGVAWGVPRWNAPSVSALSDHAPPKLSEDSSKENKDSAKDPSDDGNANPSKTSDASAVEAAHHSAESMQLPVAVA